MIIQLSQSFIKPGNQETYGHNYSHDTLRVGYALGDRREQAYVGSGVAEGKNSVGVLILICVGVS